MPIGRTASEVRSSGVAPPTWCRCWATGPRCWRISAESGEVNAADVIAAAQEQGFSESQIVSARSRSRDPRISSRRGAGFGGGGGFMWRIEQPQHGQDRQVHRR
jgi:hypothetical protein